MSSDALDAVIAAERALIAALDACDAAAVEASTADYRHALGRVKAIDGWRQDDTIKTRANEALALADAARVRVNVMADHTRQRLQLLAAGRGQAGPIVYRRDGQLTS